LGYESVSLLKAADGLKYSPGEAEEFSALTDFRPAIWLFFALLLLAYQAWALTREVNW